MQIKEQTISSTTDKFDIDEPHVLNYHCFIAAKNLETINNG